MTYSYPKLRLAKYPDDIVVDPITDKTYMANFRFHSVSVVDGLSDKLITEIKVGRFPLSVTVNPDSSNVYVKFSF